MRYDTRYRYNSQFRSYFPLGVKWLLISNVAIYTLYLAAGLFGHLDAFEDFKLVPHAVLHEFKVWQLFTYMFLHQIPGIWHILFNMLTLWMFGMDLEKTWGTRRFLKYYFLCGVGAAICVVLVSLRFGNPYQATIGASGAIFGLLLAFGMLFPDRQILIFFLFPVPAKYAVMIFGAIAFYGSLNINSGVSNIAHLGGMLFGYAYLRMRFAHVDMDYFNKRYKDWKLRRAKKKFQVYLKKHGGPWVN